MVMTTADCDREIARLQKVIDDKTKVLAQAKANHGPGWNTTSVQMSCKDEIERCKKQINSLQKQKKSLKDTSGSRSKPKKKRRFLRTLLKVLFFPIVIIGYLFLNNKKE